MNTTLVSNFELEKIYRPSSTLIIAAKTNTDQQGYNYRFLLAKRSAAIAFAPDHYVFPGGVYDEEADSCNEWLVYLKEFGVKSQDLDKLCLHYLPNRPKPLMTNGVNLSRDISLRITAIRETFEEVGLLLCIKCNDFKNNRASKNSTNNYDRLHWQQKVHKNAKEFLNLCKYLNVLPDLWSLYEWSIWRSPPTALKKYDTVVYVTTLSDQPTLLLEPTEVEKELWSTPIACLKLYTKQSIWLAPLQFYEISRLASCLSWSKLRSFVKNRNSKGSTLLMLAYFQCNDYLVGVLPGDDYYPSSTLDHKETKKLNLTKAEFEIKTKNIHRLTYYDMYSLSITSNIIPIDGQLSPVLQFDSHSKL